MHRLGAAQRTASEPIAPAEVSERRRSMQRHLQKRGSCGSAPHLAVAEDSEASCSGSRSALTEASQPRRTPNLGAVAKAPSIDAIPSADTGGLDAKLKADRISRAADATTLAERVSSAMRRSIGDAAP